MANLDGFQAMSYTEKEQEGMSENRKRINKLSALEWAREWNRVTRDIREVLGYERI